MSTVRCKFCQGTCDDRDSINACTEWFAHMKLQQDLYDDKCRLQDLHEDRDRAERKWRELDQACCALRMEITEKEKILRYGK